MSLVGIELDNGDLVIEFTQTAAETGGELHAQQARYAARSRKPPYHCHPRQDEHFSVLEGALLFHIDGEDRAVGAGEQIDIARGRYHWARNPHGEPALVLWETRPALRTAEFFVAMNRASKGGRARPPLTEAAAILREFRNEFRLRKPGPLVQRIVFPCLAPFGRRALRKRSASAS